jgi:peroxiredoxin
VTFLIDPQGTIQKIWTTVRIDQAGALRIAAELRRG